MTAYASWSVVFGEQPSAAKWNTLGTNDSSFNDGTGIANMEIGSGHTSIKLDYKFSVYRNSALTVSTGSFTKVSFDTKDWDTSSNFDAATNFVFTAPVAGFYHFSGAITWNTTASMTRMITSLFKNAAEYKRSGDSGNTGANAGSVVLAANMQLAANDTVDLRVQPVGANSALLVGSAPRAVYFEGFLISQT